jgi:hypothetical protein
MKIFELFIDELGQFNPLSNQSNVYVLCGCVIDKNEREELRIKADQIKYKYWNRTDIVFHSKELGRNENDFSIFQNNPKKKQEFLNDLINYLKKSNIYVFVINLDLKLAKNKGWNSVKVIQETAKKLFYHFIVWLLGVGGVRGKICIESATAEKDRYYLNEFSYFLSPGCKELSVDHKLIREIITSISFVTKRNYDIEQQLADLFAYAAKCKYMRLSKKDSFKIGSYEDRMIKVLEVKLFKKPRNAKERKMKFYEAIDPFCILP